MINDELTKDFEKYFPLPMTFDEKNSVIEASNGITLAYTSKYLVQGRQARNALKRTWRYAIQCSNLMPEAVELLKDTNTKLKQLCEICGFENIGNECIRCTMPGLVTRVDALLAKLEGGADNA